MTLGGLAGLGAAFAFVLGLLFVTLRLLRGLPALAGRQSAGPELRVLSRAALSPRQGVATVQAGDRVLVIGYGEGGVHALSEIPAEADCASAVASEVVEPAAIRKPTIASNLRWAPSDAAVSTAAASIDASQNGAAANGAASAGSPADAGSAVLAGPMPFRQAFARALKQARILVIGLVALGLTASSASAATTPLTPSGSKLTAASVANTAISTLPAPSTAILSAVSATQQAPETGGIQLPSMDLRLGDGSDDDLRLEGPVGTVLFVGFLTLIPTLLLMMTGFTRILVVLHLLKQALGTQTAPPAHLLAAMALLLTGFVMRPALETAHTTAIQPWMDGEIDEMVMIKTASVPFREFMGNSVRQEDLRAFMEMSDTPPVETVEEIPLVVLTAAFVTSELRAAFQMGFALFLPFVIIDIVVASVLMSMGMFMLPPVMVSLPFKLLLFVLVDGWALVMGSLVKSFG